MRRSKSGDWVSPYVTKRSANFQSARVVLNPNLSKRAPDGKSGVYIIAEAPADDSDEEHGRVLYVGHSHTGALRRTLIRHFQHWKGATAGVTYDPATVVVLIYTTDDGEEAKRWERAAIKDFGPRDNDEGNDWLSRIKGFLVDEA